MKKRITKQLRKLKREFTDERERLTKLGFSNSAYKAKEPRIKAYQILLDEGHSLDQTIKIFEEL